MTGNHNIEQHKTRNIAAARLDMDSRKDATGRQRNSSATRIRLNTTLDERIKLFRCERQPQERPTYSQALDVGSAFGPRVRSSFLLPFMQTHSAARTPKETNNSGAALDLFQTQPSWAAPWCVTCRKAPNLSANGSGLNPAASVQRLTCSRRNLLDKQFPQQDGWASTRRE